MQRDYQSLEGIIDGGILLLAGVIGGFAAFAPEDMYRTVVVDMLGGTYFSGQKELILVVAIAMVGGLYLIDWVMD